jgi:hypothetical protein
MMSHILDVIIKFITTWFTERTWEAQEEGSQEAQACISFKEADDEEWTRKNRY